ncbi:MAG: DMT family transporter [Candidatus Obscuribacterales bacterium]|nr:DMT family transporter [Candidatus Obscuribacterales bacterium]
MASIRTSLLLGLFFVVFVWGANAVVVKFLFQDMSAFTYVGLRYICLLPLALIVVLAGGHKLRLKKESLLVLVGASIIGFGIPQILGYLGLANTTAFASSLFGATTPLATLAICYWRNLEVVSGARWVGALICIAGLAIFEGALSGQMDFNVGDLLALSSALLAGIYNVMVVRLVKDYDPVVLMFWVITISSFMVIPICTPAMLAQDWAADNHLDWALMAFSVVFPVIVAHPIWHWAIKQDGAGTTSLWALLCPLVAGTVAAVWLGTTVLPHEAIGAVITLMGLALAQVSWSRIAAWRRARGLAG